jgi:Inner membrane protein YgaP-like, transmembrane domain
MGFAQFMSSGLGRGLRIVAGIVLIAIGLGMVGGTGGMVLAVVGLVPLLAGLLDVCLIGALFGAPLRGAEVRAHAKQ